MHVVHGVVQHYAWGDTSFLPQLLGRPADGRPWAEWWLGTHPNGPSMLDDGRPLTALTDELPYLLKVLAAAQPLSLQTHPDADRARRGHAAGRYPDANPKPELLCALTPVTALCGFRAVDASLELLDRVGATALADVLRGDGLLAALTALYRRTLDAGPIVAACSGADVPEAAWVGRLAERYPDDPSVAVTLLLNLVELAPGEAIRLDPGNLHAYLAGAGVELMGASDNVVRGGLTVKPVDVDDLLDVVDPTPLVDPVIAIAARYPLPAAGVALLRLVPGDRHTATTHELGFDLAGSAWYLAPGEPFVAERSCYLVTA